MNTEKKLSDVDKVIIEKPDGSPYLTFRKDDKMVHIRMHDYDYTGNSVEMNFDIRATEQVIIALQKIGGKHE